MSTSVPVPLQTSLSIEQLLSERVSVRRFGAKPDGRVFQGTIFAGSTTLTCPPADADFTLSPYSPAPDLNYRVGHVVWIRNGGPGGSSAHFTTVARVIDATTLEIADPVSVDATGECRVGTDNTAFIQTAFNLSQSSGIRIVFPRGMYLTTASLIPRQSLAITGECWSPHGHAPNNLASVIMCCADVPILKTDEADSESLPAFSMEKLSLRGTGRSGSMGLDFHNVNAASFRDLAFDNFGDNAVLVRAGIDALFDHIFIQNAMLVRTGRTDYVGCFDILIHDAVCHYVTATASSITDESGVGDGFIVGIANRGTNTFWTSCYGHLSQAGWYMTGSLNTFVNCRADLNYGHGYVLGPGSGILQSCRAHANSVGGDGAYNGYEEIGGTYRYLFCQNTFNGPGGEGNPFFNRVKWMFHTNKPGYMVASHFTYCESSESFSYVGDASDQVPGYHFSGEQIHSCVKLLTSLYPELPGSDCDIMHCDVVLNNGYGAVFRGRRSVDEFNDPNSRYWGIGTNYGPGYSQFTIGTVGENNIGGQFAMLFDRIGTTPSLIQFLATQQDFYGKIRSFKNIDMDPGGSGSNLGAGTGYVLFSPGGVACGLFYSAGNPNGTLSSGYPAGSLCLDPVTPAIWMKQSAAWVSITAGAVDASLLTGVVALVNGGTAANSAAGARFNLDVPSFAEMDAAIAAAIAGIDTSGLVTKAQHNAHDHFYTGDGSGTVSDHTSTANPTL